MLPPAPTKTMAPAPRLSDTFTASGLIPSPKATKTMAPVLLLSGTSTASPLMPPPEAAPVRTMATAHRLGVSSEVVVEAKTKNSARKE